MPDLGQSVSWLERLHDWLDARSRDGAAKRAERCRRWGITEARRRSLRLRWIVLTGLSVTPMSLGVGLHWWWLTALCVPIYVVGLSRLVRYR